MTHGEVLAIYRYTENKNINDVSGIGIEIDKIRFRWLQKKIIFKLKLMNKL